MTIFVPGYDAGTEMNNELCSFIPGPACAPDSGNKVTDEFGTIVYEEDASRTYKVGDSLELIVSHCDPVVNLYDQMYAIRGDRVEAVWQVAARGLSA